MKPSSSGQSPDGGESRGAHGAGEDALAWVRRNGRAAEFDRRVGAEVRRRRRTRGAALAAVAVLVFGSAVALRREAADPPASPARTPMAASAAIGPETLTLPDGTAVELNVGARLTVEFAAAATGPRLVRLAHGEAHFQVAKNPARPFVVSAGGVEVRAVGTAFAVRLGAEAVDVLVTEGRVAVEAAQAGAGAPTLVDAGQRARVERAGAPGIPVAALTDAEARERLAWRVPMLDLSGTRLAEALPLFNRHAPVPLALAEAGLGDLKVSGLLRADNTAAFLRLLQSEFGLVAETQSGAILIRRP